MTPVTNEWSHACVLFQNKQDRLLLSDLGGTQPLFLHWWRHHLDWMFPICFCIYFQSIFAFVKSQFRLNAFQFTFAFVFNLFLHWWTHHLDWMLFKFEHSMYVCMLYIVSWDWIAASKIQNPIFLIFKNPSSCSMLMSDARSLSP